MTNRGIYRKWLLLAILCSLEGASAMLPPTQALASSVTLRGGSSSSAEVPKKTKKKKKKKKTAKAKKVIDSAMKEKDAAEALGDAIRDRAQILRDEDPMLQSIDWSINSLGHALGASDERRRDGGGVQASQSSVVANYFLKSHGGAHALQSLCSFLSTLAGFGVLAFAQSNPKFGFTLLQRTLQFAMLKHVSGLLAAASIAARAIPKIGLSQSRQWMEKIVLDPVSQYVFYSALLLLWLPSKTRFDAVGAWWWKKSVLPALLVVPILVREYISNLLVISDLLVLWSVGDDSPTSDAIQTCLKISQSIINAVMSLLVTPQAWRGADPAGRQAILAKLVSRVSLAFEVGVGALLLVDVVLGFFAAAFGGSHRPSLRESLTRILCVRLYVHFLWVRRGKISHLATQVRGGAAQLPIYILDAVYEPAKALGLDQPPAEDPSEMTWRDYAAVGLGISSE